MELRIFYTSAHAPLPGTNGVKLFKTCLIFEKGGSDLISGLIFRLYALLQKFCRVWDVPEQEHALQWPDPNPDSLFAACYWINTVFPCIIPDAVSGDFRGKNSLIFFFSFVYQEKTGTAVIVLVLIIPQISVRRGKADVIRMDRAQERNNLIQPDCFIELHCLIQPDCRRFRYHLSRFSGDHPVSRTDHRDSFLPHFVRGGGKMLRDKFHFRKDHCLILLRIDRQHMFPDTGLVSFFFRENVHRKVIVFYLRFCQKPPDLLR